MGRKTDINPYRTIYQLPNFALVFNQCKNVPDNNFVFSMKERKCIYSFKQVRNHTILFNKVVGHIMPVIDQYYRSVSQRKLVSGDHVSKTKLGTLVN